MELFTICKVLWIFFYNLHQEKMSLSILTESPSILHVITQLTTMQLNFIIYCETCAIIHLDNAIVHVDRISVNFVCDKTIHNNIAVFHHYLWDMIQTIPYFEIPAVRPNWGKRIHRKYVSILYWTADHFDPNFYLTNYKSNWFNNSDLNWNSYLTKWIAYNKLFCSKSWKNILEIQDN